MIHRVDSVDEFKHMLDESVKHPVFILKHSSACPVSACAYQVVSNFMLNNNDYSDFSFAVVIIQDHRAVSNFIAEFSGIKHESPQVLLFKDKKVIWNADHHGISLDSLSGALNK
ncbi:bacillithiol system redox-active protein YtxJ [Candidatus Woesearchaeota archaeon]|nr:bacillithiol system redox-active protein YtxJ [Candidatus Woesearchaeota archaeon]MCF7901688.1 bacillithiol system redox-active protein YtxJ [Candidatus Woesearchaeota archaeon]MCF8014056.1 bacillithiol system redox-active protein YtxJ [Candidatus Woesearchaeota archaeon]